MAAEMLTEEQMALVSPEEKEKAETGKAMIAAFNRYYDQVLEADLDQQGKLVEPLLERIQALMDEQLDLEDWLGPSFMEGKRLDPEEEPLFSNWVAIEDAKIDVKKWLTAWQLRNVSAQQLCWPAGLNPQVSDDGGSAAAPPAPAPPNATAALFRRYERGAGSGQGKAARALQWLSKLGRRAYMQQRLEMFAGKRRSLSARNADSRSWKLPESIATLLQTMNGFRSRGASLRPRSPATLEHLPADVIGLILSSLSREERYKAMRELRCASKAMRDLVDWTALELSIPVRSWVTPDKVEAAFSRFGNARGPGLLGCPVQEAGSILGAEGVLPKLGSLELLGETEDRPGTRAAASSEDLGGDLGVPTVPRGDLGAIVQQLGTATRLAHLSIHVTRPSDLLLVGQCRNLRRLEVCWAGEGDFAPVGTGALAELSHLESLRCTQMRGYHAIAFVAQFKSLTKVYVSGSAGVSLRPLRELAGLRELQIRMPDAQLPRDFFTRCLSPETIAELRRLDLRVRSVKTPTALQLGRCRALEYLRVSRVADACAVREKLGELPMLQYCWVRDQPVTCWLKDGKVCWTHNSFLLYMYMADPEFFDEGYMPWN